MALDGKGACLLFSCCRMYPQYVYPTPQVGADSLEAWAIDASLSIPWGLSLLYASTAGARRGTTTFILVVMRECFGMDFRKRKLVWSHGSDVEGYKRKHSIILSMTCSDLIVPDRPFAGSWPPQTLAMSGCI